MQKKGQAAMEFLMTYGWAILAAIIVIGVLAVYLRPSSLQSSSAIVTAPLYANAWNVDASDAAVNLELQNNAGESINVTSIAVTGTGSSAGTDCTLTNTPPVTMAAGATQSFAIGTGCTFTTGDSYAGDIAVRYTRGVTGTTELTSSGQISDTVVA